jgi:hypothetical protein
MGFGLIALIALMKSAIAMGAILFAGLIVGVFLKLVIEAYKWILRLIPKKNFLFSLIFITLLEMLCVLIFFLRISTGVDLWSILSFLFLTLGAVNLGEIVKEIEEWKKKSIKKTYNSKKLDKEMKEKIKFALWIIFLTIVGCSISIFLANKFSLIADFKYIEIIITTAVFFAGFGFLAMKMGKEEKDNFWAVLLPSRKSIILWSILSIISAFCYLIFEPTPFGNAFFKISVALLFFTITLILLFVIYSDNKYLRELETKNGESKIGL